MLRYAPYYRVSHKDSERGISIDLQRDHCEPFVARQGGLLVPAYVDEGKSAFEERLDKRPAFQRLLADARRRIFDAVIVYMYDRFGRRMRVALQAMHELEQCGVRVVSATESDDWLATGVSLLIAEQYSRALSRRMKDVRLHEAKAGRWVGPIPVGYDRQGGVLVPNGRIAAVRLAGQLYATGEYGIQRIAIALNTAGHTMPSGAPFKATQVEEMLKCPAYAGLVTCSGQVLPGQHEAAWDAALWTRIQEVAHQRSQRRTKADTPHDPLLAGLAFCGACGAAMWHNPRMRGQRRTYRCATHTHQGAGPIADLSCIRRESPADATEGAVLTYVAGIALSGDLLLQARQLVAPTTRPQLNQAEIDQKLRRLARAFGDGAYSEQEYEEKRRALLAQFEQQSAPEPIDTDALIALLADIPALLAEASNAHRRAILRELLDGVWIARGELLAVRPTRLCEVLFREAQHQRDQVLQRGCEWAGRASSLDSPPLLKSPALIISS